MRKVLLLTSALLPLLTACGERPESPSPLPPPRAEAAEMNAEARAFAQIVEDHWALSLREDPILAEELGDEGGRGRLPDPSLEAYEAGIEARRDLRARLDAVASGELPEAQRLNHALLVRQLDDEIEAARYNGRYFTISTYFAPHLSLARIAERANLRRRADIESYLGRLEAMSGYMGAAIARLDEGAAKGWTQPCQSMHGFERTYRTHIVEDAQASVFFQPLAHAEGVTEQDRARALRAIDEGVVPAFREFGSFFEATYLPNCRAAAGVGSLDGGAEFYAYRARSYTTTEMTPDDIHQIGLSEVARIRAEMETVAAEAGFAELSAFQDHLRTSLEYYPQTAEERIAAASTIAKKMDGQLVHLFTVLPRMPYDIQPIPLDVAEGTTTAYYSGPAADGSRAGTYWINTTQLESRPLYELESLTLHEAVPGHHLQIALSHELDLPEFRRFGGFTAFTEGWGLYSERLGLETGFYATPETNFGRLSYEMWRACRLVVDTGMHAKNWTRQQAIDFMLENTGLSEVNIIREVDRYITWPGQALAYKIGELKIRELRERAEDALGDDFDVRLFHDAVLSHGALPLSVLEEEIDRWIEAQRADPDTQLPGE